MVLDINRHAEWRVIEADVLRTNIQHNKLSKEVFNVSGKEFLVDVVGAGEGSGCG